MNEFDLEFITREGCTLCAAIQPEVERLAGRMGARLQVIDVDLHPYLADEFGGRVPVVRTPSGRVLGEGRIGLARLRWAMRRERLRS